MGTAASSDLLVQASVTENTPGGNRAKTWHLCIRLSWHVDLPYMFKPSWWCIHFVFRHPSSWQASVINSREPWDGVQRSTGLGEVSRRWAPMTLQHLNQTLLSGCKHLMGTMKEQNYCMGQPICEYHLTRKAFLSQEKFMASQSALFSSQAEKGISCKVQDTLLKAGSVLLTVYFSSLIF